MEEKSLVTTHERLKSLLDLADRVEIDESIPPEKRGLLSLLIWCKYVYLGLYDSLKFPDLLYI
jgi:hypothetical protein